MNRTDWFPVLLSFRVAALSVVVIVALGLPLARILARRSFPGQDLLEALLTMPLVLPPTVVGFGLLLLVGKTGPVGRLLGMAGISLVFTWWAAVLAAVVVAFPLMYQSAKAAFKSVDVNLENAARTLGVGEVRIFWAVTMPLAWPGLLTGVVLSFARALGEFGATLMVAGNIPGRTQTAPLAIYYAVYAGDNGTATRLVLILTVISFLVIFLVNRWARRRNFL